jgi:hypothetical protein
MNDQLLQTVDRFNRIAVLENNRDLTRAYDGKVKSTKTPEYTHNFGGLYNYRGNKGTLKYSMDTSVRSDPIRLDKWGNEYEEGRRTLLTETTNSYGVNVGGYVFKNSAVKKHSNNRTPGLNIVGINL